MDLERACSKVKLSDESGRHYRTAITVETGTGIRSSRMFYGLSDNPTQFYGKTDQTLK